MFISIRWLQGNDYDVKDKFDQFARQQSEDDYESSMDGLPSVENKNKDEK